MRVIISFTGWHSVLLLVCVSIQAKKPFKMVAVSSSMKKWEKNVSITKRQFFVEKMHEVISFFVTKYVLRIIEDFNVQQQIFYGQGMCFGKEWEFYARPNVTTQNIQEDNWKKEVFFLYNHNNCFEFGVQLFIPH